MPVPPPVTVRVPSKVNLHLAVGGLRPDGYHDLVTIFQALSLTDEVTVAVADEAGILEHCRKHLGGFQVPKFVRILDEMPMTATGKLRKVELRQSFSEHFTGK